MPSNGSIFRVIGPMWGEFTGHRWIPLTKASDAELWCFFFDLRLNKRSGKQSKRMWFETPSRPLWRNCNDFSGLGISVGQNLAFNYDSWDDAIQAWYDEVEDFRYGSTGGYVLHFTQVSGWTHLTRYKIVVVSQKTFSNLFS